MSKRSITMKSLVKTFNSFAYEHDLWTLFSDWLGLAACSISCQVDFATKDEREARYMETISRYKPEDQKLFGQILGQVAIELEKPRDVLGDLFGELELHSKAKGQFFTPYHLSRMMADIVVEDQERYRLCEPACGSGGMVIAFSEALRSKGKNPQRVLHAYCQDIDLRAVQMCYIQLSLLGISAVVDHMDTLRMERISLPWKTPAYMMGPALWMLLDEQNAPEKTGQLSLFEEVDSRC